MVRVHKIGIELRIVASQGPGIIYSGGSRISPRSGRQLSGGGGGTPTYDFANFSQKLHEIERIWTPGGGARVQNFTM